PLQQCLPRVRITVTNRSSPGSSWKHSRNRKNNLAISIRKRRQDAAFFCPVSASTNSKPDYMPIELKIPAVGESISEVEIGDWRKAEGDPVKKDEIIAVLESEKATVELPAPADGTLGRILKSKGQTAGVGEVIGYLNEPGKAAEKKTPSAEAKKDGAG